jgi:hypothetical protein
MNDALWIDHFAARLGYRWPSILAEEASKIASSLATEGAWRELGPDDSADAYVWSIEEVREVKPSAFELVFSNSSGPDAPDALRACAAAAEVFREAGLTPAACARGWFERAGWDRRGFIEDDERPSDDEIDAAMAWDRAELAAAKAYGGEVTGSAGLELLWRSRGA